MTDLVVFRKKLLKFLQGVQAKLPCVFTTNMAITLFLFNVGLVMERFALGQRSPDRYKLAESLLINQSINSINVIDLCNQKYSF